MQFARSNAHEWLEADGLGGFASGCTDLTATRRYHALLLVARRPPGERMALVQGLEAHLVLADRRLPLCAHRYQGSLVHPRGDQQLRAFRIDPWPRWTFDGGPAGEIELELFVPRGHAAVVLSWRAERAVDGAHLELRPLLSGRDPHRLLAEGPQAPYQDQPWPGGIAWRDLRGGPSVFALHTGRYASDPDWYRRFEYAQERARGYDFQEDLFSPGVLQLPLCGERAVLVLHADPGLERRAHELGGARALGATWRELERARRSSFAGPLERAAEAYVVRRGSGTSLIAGYPWFGDWGRDTFLALRGLCLATGRLEDARQILLEWSRHVDAGLLPNRFPDDGSAPEYNSVDAALWFALAIHELQREAQRRGVVLGASGQAELARAAAAVVDGMFRGTHHGIRVDADGLLAAGESGQQLTWMDARVEGREVTPRSGKPVEIQALWINVLLAAGAARPEHAEAARRARSAFQARFWNPATGYLNDVVDCAHEAGRIDATLRPNQILAVGGLPHALLSGALARRVVDVVEARLWTPLGLRTLDPDHPDYRGRYQGSARERDLAYHQGTAWPWLLGPFVEAWLRVRTARGRPSPALRRQARERFVRPLFEHLEQAGLGHVSEMADGDAPHSPGGCPFQAWSLGELLRLERCVLGTPAPGGQVACEDAPREVTA
jgi:predicted glycogen debranching enzyme